MKQVPLSTLLAWLDQYMAQCFTIVASSEAELKSLQTKLLVLEGSFNSLADSEKARAYWRSAAVKFLLKYEETHPQEPKGVVIFLAARKLGCGVSSLRKWYNILKSQPYGAGYWHLLLTATPKPPKHPAIWIKITDMLRKGERPSKIATVIQSVDGVKMSVRTVQRIAKEEHALGHLVAKRYVNRFK